MGMLGGGNGGDDRDGGGLFGAGSPLGGGGPFQGKDGPDLEELMANVKKTWPILVAVLVLGGLVLIGSQSFFTVEPEEEALVLRLGKPTSEIYGPGLHGKIPFVDREFVAPVQRQHRIEFGFRSQPGKVTQVQEQGYEDESLMLTGDLLLAHVRWTVIYRIDDIATWLFNVKDREETIRDVAMAVMRQLVGDYSLHEVLTTKVREIQTHAMAVTQTALRENVPTGVAITELSIRSTDVPGGAKKAFDEFNRTEPDVSRQLAEAKAEQDNVTGDAEQQKKRAIGQAEKEAEQIIQSARGEALAFAAKLHEYRKAPEITRQWMYLQTMERLLDGMEEKLVLDDTGGGGTGVGGGTLKLLPLTDLMGGGASQVIRPAAAARQAGQGGDQ